MNTDRKKYAAKNFIWATVGNIANSILTFISRTIFIYTLGTLYNGINGLYTNVLGMLALAELGVGQAVSFSLYKPLAENNVKKIQAIINFYRIAYRIIAAVVLVIGVGLAPFLKYIIKGADGVEHLVLYYFIFLFNTVSSYLLVYKSTLVEADQKKYLITNINTIIKGCITISQIIVLLISRNFLCYLLIGMVVQFLGNVYINYYAGKMYPFLIGHNDEQLSKADKQTILTKIRALMAHKIGEKAVNQTDNIIISAFINVSAVGLVANYTMLINLINTFVIAFFNGATAAIGNIIATESEDRSYVVSKRFDFIGYVLYGWASLCLFFLLPPFISLWIGSDKVIDSMTCFLLCFNFFFAGLRVPFANVKSAAGIYEQDKWVPLAQAAVNLGVSIVGAKYLGLIGVYLGTLASSLVPQIVRPIVVYKYIFNRSSKSYFKELIKRIMQLSICFLVLYFVFDKVHITNVILDLFFRLLTCSLVMTIEILLCYRNKDELQYIINIIKKVIKNNVLRGCRNE